MSQSQKPKRPPVTRQTRGQVYDFVIQEMPDPMGHLTEEQKKWFVLDLDAPKDNEEYEAVSSTPRAPKSSEC